MVRRYVRHYVQFKGTEAEYNNLHQWVKYHLGKPKKCETCGTTENRVYHWANISGEYKRDLSDWRRLCVPCHAKFDGLGYGNTKGRLDISEFCRRGHALTEANIYKSPSHGNMCRTCRKDWQREYQTTYIRKPKERNS